MSVHSRRARRAAIALGIAAALGLTLAAGNLPARAATQPADTTAGPQRIRDIQGDGWISPDNNQAVTNVPGVVTGIRKSGSSRGYWIQDPTPDSDPTTSEGIFVYGSATAVAVGDSVLVSGSAKDYYTLSTGETLSTTSSLSVTEISGATVSVLSHGNALPAPIVIGPKTIPNLYAPYVGGNIENTPVTPTRSTLDWMEAHEGMRVEVDNARVIGPTDSYGELYVTDKPTQQRTYRGGSYIPSYTDTPSGKLEVAPVGTAPKVNVGDTLAGATSGPLDWSPFGGYVIAATQVGTATSGGIQPEVAKKQSGKQLAVATYNVENLAPSNSADKFSRLAHGIVTSLAAPDIVTVEEVQDNDGAKDDGVVAADQTLTKLTDAIVAAGGPRYAWRAIDPVNDEDGGQPGGNIRSVFLFNPDRVSFVDSGTPSSTEGTQVLNYHGTIGLTRSPGRIDPTNAAWTDSRKPLVGQFLFRGQPVFVIGNHFDSKGGDQNANGRYQPPARSSEVQRQQQAAIEHDFVSSLLKVDKQAKVVVLGDLNDYQFSPALQVLKTGTAASKGKSILTDLITTLPANRQYTYVYEGVSQVLDHILVTSGAGKVSYEPVHVNAEFSDQVSDHDPQVVRMTVG